MNIDSQNTYTLITGSAGFIGSCLANHLYRQNKNLILVDDFNIKAKQKNYKDLDKCIFVSRDKLFDWLQQEKPSIEIIFHLGARTDTTCTDVDLLNALNLNYSKQIWEYCTSNNIPLIYASSAATYGLGEYGFDDNHSTIQNLKPLNLYGESKQQFDVWALSQSTTPPVWYGLKFFNVFGPNEFHKGRMASVIYHTYHQILKTGSMKLFRSHKKGIENGHQERDFIYIKDVILAMLHLSDTKPNNGIYNLGTGQSRTFLDLATSVFQAMDLEAQISFIDTPIDIRDKYQYYTCAKMDKFIKSGFTHSFYTLEDAIEDYVRKHLMTEHYY